MENHEYVIVPRIAYSKIPDEWTADNNPID